MAVTPMDPPPGLDAGGLALWQASCAIKQFHPGELVVLEEACRIKDRLDTFHGLLVGDLSVWMELRESRGEDKSQVVVIDSAVTEARLHASELRQLVERLRLPMALAGDGDGQEAPKEAPPDDVAARRAQRAERRGKAGAAGS